MAYCALSLCRVKHRLLTASRKQLYPLQRQAWERCDGEWETRAGAPIFQDVIAGPSGVHRTSHPGGDLECSIHRLVVALPEPGEYLYEVSVVKELPEAIACTLPDKSKLSLTLQDSFLGLRFKVCLRSCLPRQFLSAAECKSARVRMARRRLCTRTDGYDTEQIE